MKGPIYTVLSKHIIIKLKNFFWYLFGDKLYKVVQVRELVYGDVIFKYVTSDYCNK